MYNMTNSIIVSYKLVTVSKFYMKFFIFNIIQVCYNIIIVIITSSPITEESHYYYYYYYSAADRTRAVSMSAGSKHALRGCILLETLRHNIIIYIFVYYFTLSGRVRCEIRRYIIYLRRQQQVISCPRERALAHTHTRARPREQTAAATATPSGQQRQSRIPTQSGLVPDKAHTPRAAGKRLLCV